MTTQPEALRLFTHQMLNHEGKPDGVHIGCDDLEVCKQSHVDGETSPVIHEWVDAAELRRQHEENGRLRIVAEMSTLLLDQRSALLEALKGITPPMPPADAPCHVGLVPQEKCAHCGRIARARAAIKAAEENT